MMAGLNDGRCLGGICGGLYTYVYQYEVYIIGRRCICVDWGGEVGRGEVKMRGRSQTQRSLGNV
jgi:hypothetical protein